MKLAVIKTGGKQYKVKEGEILKIEKISGEPGEKFAFDKVLLISDEKGDNLELGQPYLADKKVEAEIMEQGRSRKMQVIKFKSKTRYRRNLGHRQHYTKVKINKI